MTMDGNGGNNINLQVLYSQTDFSGAAVPGWTRARQETLALLADSNLQSS